MTIVVFTSTGLIRTLDSTEKYVDRGQIITETAAGAPPVVPSGIVGRKMILNINKLGR